MNDKTNNGADKTKPDGRSVFGDISALSEEKTRPAFSTANPDEANLEELEDATELEDTEGASDGGNLGAGDADGEDAAGAGTSEGDEDQAGEGADGAGSGEGDGELRLSDIPAVDPAAGKDLGEYKPEANKAAFEAEYLKGDELNFERLSAEWWLNAQTGKDIAKGALHPSTYAFLRDKFGVTDATIKQYEKGLLADTKLRMGEADRQFSSIVKSVGGSAKVEQAIAWAKEGGYTEEQRKRFNAIRDSGDAAAIQDSLEALMARFTKAGGAAPQNKPPKKSATDGKPTAGGTGSDVFASMEDYNAAYREASALRRKDPRAGDAALAAAKAKLARSPVFRNRNKKA